MAIHWFHILMKVGERFFQTDNRMGPAVRHPETGNLSHWPNDWDASYIVTAQPATILALIAEVERNAKNALEFEASGLYWMDERDKLRTEVESLTAEVERLKLYAEAKAKGADRAGKALCASAREMREIRAELHCVSMENESLKASNLYWLSKPGSGLIRCVPDARYRKFAPSIRARYEPVRVIDAAMSKESGQ